MAISSILKQISYSFLKYYFLLINLIFVKRKVQKRVGGSLPPHLDPPLSGKPGMFKIKLSSHPIGFTSSETILG